MFVKKKDNGYRLWEEYRALNENYLGYEISESGIRPGNRKIRTVFEFPTPSNVNQVRQFVGLASFFRRFIYNSVTLTKPLTNLTKSDVALNWGSEQEPAFQEIKV